MLTESEGIMKLYKGIVKGRQRQLKTEGTGMWFSTSEVVAKTYSDEVETWELDTSLPLKAVQINCHQKSWNEINTDAYARKYKDYDVIIFKDIVDVGPLVLNYTKQGDTRTSKEAFKDFTADTIVVNNRDCIKKVQTKILKEFDSDWMKDSAKLNAVKVEDLIEDKYLDKALEYYELFEELTLRGDYKKAEDRSEEDMKKLSKVTAELLATYINLVDSEFNAHICVNGEFDNESVQFSDSYRVFYDRKDNNTGNYITVYSFNSEEKSNCVFLNFSHEETEGVQELLEFAFNQCELAEKSNETIWSNAETNWIVDIDVIIELIEDFKNPYGINNSDLGVKAEYEKNRASRSCPLDEACFTDLTDLEQIQDDWLYVLEKVEDSEPFIIEALKSIPVHYVEDLRSDNGRERVAEFVVANGLDYSLNVGEVYFELKREVAIGALLHEIAHAILTFRYLLTGNTSAYNLYAKTNSGHTEDWWKIATELTKYFNEKIEIVETLDLRDVSIYEYPVSFESYNDDVTWNEDYFEFEGTDSIF